MASKKGKRPSTLTKRKPKKPASEHKLGQIAGLVLGIVGTIGLVSAYQIYKSAPDVDAPVAYDPAQPFLVPITINNQTFVNLYSVRPACELNIKDITTHNELNNFTISTVGWNVIQPKETKTYDCGMKWQGDVRDLVMVLDLSFELRIIPFFPWHKSMKTYFHIVITSDGAAHWVQGRNT